jgi:hypothetical protein
MYWIYENWTADKKAVIHRAGCGHCNDGRGVGTNKLGDRNGRWHGPYRDYEQARAAAVALPDRGVRDCRLCGPA